MGGTSTRSVVRFWLNDELVELPNVSATDTLLDFLRLDRTVRGTKEGCAEGDCGACTILVGRLSGGDTKYDGIKYESVNSCIRLVASLDGCHVVSVEHLSADGQLHPVQQALVEHHGSQCGFCTPGIVMSLYALWMAEPAPDDLAIEQALQGNLCRCTGYAPIIRAAKAASAAGGQGGDVLLVERARMVSRLTDLKDQKRVIGDQFFIPANVDDLAHLYAEHPQATIIAGATDVGLWVTKHMRSFSPAIFVGHLEQLKMTVPEQDSITLGAGVTYSDFAPFVAEHYPQLSDFWSRIGGTQVRNMGTVGGNIANGSPIGDTPPALIALGAAITLRKGDDRRFIRLEDYFIAYGKQARAEGEFVESITIPHLAPEDQFEVYKISKRRDEDISSVCGAFRLRLNADYRVAEIVIAFGGMAATPKRASAVEKALIGQAWRVETVERAIADFAKDFQPIGDMRASAEYRLIVAQNLLRRFFFETQGERVQLARGVA